MSVAIGLSIPIDSSTSEKRFKAMYEEDYVNPGPDPDLSMYKWEVVQEHSIYPSDSSAVANPIPPNEYFPAHQIDVANEPILNPVDLSSYLAPWVSSDVVRNLDWRTGIDSSTPGLSMPVRVTFDSPIDLYNIWAFGRKDFINDSSVMILNPSVYIVDDLGVGRFIQTSDFYQQNFFDQGGLDRTSFVTYRLSHPSNRPILQNVKLVYFLSTLNGAMGLKEIKFNIDSYSLN